jgi:hypothetical protein
MNLPFPPFLPDLSAIGGGLNVCNNTYPKVDGYGPIPGVTTFSAALTGTFKGGASFIAKDGNSSLLVGTSTNLLKYSGATWTSLVASLAIAEHWRFAQFGDYVIGVNGSVTKGVDLVAGTAATLTDAPTGKVIAIVGDFVVIGQDSGDLTGIYTSEEGNHTAWDVVTTGATYQPMLAGGEVMGLGGGEYGVILQRNRIVRMSRTGDTTAPPNTVPFAYDVIADNIGCASKGSVAQHDNRVFFLSDAGFKVIWCVPGSPGKLWIYNWELDRWATATLNLDGVFSGFTSSVDLETLAVTYTDLDAMTISLDDPRWAGGNPRLYAVQAGAVGTFFGANLEATFSFSFSELTNARYSRISSVRPVGDVTAGLTLSLDARARLGDAENVKTVTDLRTSGIMPIRHSGRYVKPSLTIAAGATWGYISALEFEGEAGGRR